ncbi:SHOCT domain-containing protein [Alicyclobacillus sp. SO9]|uniref:SHOCT domain-containing protein n=1 Tax=Alicyclobacillus sp. SO9 TaxID=2665646 RepID=UPI0018E79431|nr:SHOCT domain-containing protein [Alicyclobacillus sp. SO9]QQE78451.1 SHOCT domain-containing protein [Alicyclobacillus sp. SO9]
MPFPFPIPPMEEPIERRQSGKEILKTRLARGEITLEEYEEMISVLDNGPHVSRPISRSQKRTSHIRMP